MKDSIPDHSNNIKLNLDVVITNSGLDPVDTHACALASALIAGNGGLAFEIEHNSPLFFAEAEREAAKAAASLAGMITIWDSFSSLTSDSLSLMTGDIASSELHMDNYSGVSNKKFQMYLLAACTVCQSSALKHYYNSLKADGMSVQELMAIGRIAAVVTAIGKIAI